MPNRVRVLLVDDEPLVLSSVARLLTLMKYNVTTAGSAAAAQELLLAQSFGVVILDLRMPLVSGRDLLSWIRHRAPQLPVVVYSGYSDDELGFLDEHTVFLVKPFRREQLDAALRRALEGGRVSAS